MPSSKNIQNLGLGFGRLHQAVASASAELFDPGGATATVVGSLVTAINQELAVVTTTADTVSAGDASFILSGATVPFVGSSPTDPIDDLFRLVDTSDQEIYDATDTIIRVASIAFATIGDGFVTANVRLNFTAVIPNGVTYRIYYGKRKTLGALPANSFSYPAILRSPQVEREIQNLFRDLHEDTGTPVWNGSWLTSIASLARSGLDDRYRRKRGHMAGNLDTPGDGGTITRDGQAVTVNVADTANLFYDPIGGCWKVQSTAVGAGGFIPDESSGLAFVHYVSDRSSNDANEGGPANSSGSFGCVWPHQHLAAFGGAVWTQVLPGNVATLNPGGAGADIVELGVGDFWYNGSNLSAVNCGFDMVEVRRLSGATEVYVITSLDIANPRRATVRDLVGGVPTFGVGEATICRWFSTKYWQGPSTGQKRYQLLGGEQVLLGPLQNFVSPSNGHAVSLTESAPIFSASDDLTAIAMYWTGHLPDASGGIPGVQVNLTATNRYGALLGSGGIQTGGKSSFGPFAEKTQTIGVTVTGAQEWSLYRYPRVIVNPTVDAKTLTITLPVSGWTPTEGEQIEMLVTLGGAVATFNITWPSGGLAEFYFSSIGDKTPTQGSNSVTLYRGTYKAVGAPGFYMTKTAYPSGGVSGP